MVDKDNLFIFLLDDSNNIKNEINIVKPKSYKHLLYQLRNMFKELPENFYIFYNNEKNEEIKINNNEQYKLCKEILLIKKINPNKLDQSIFSMNYNLLSESKQELLDDKYSCNICNIIIKYSKPFFCYRCQKIFHQKCLLDWDKKKKSQNQVLSCPNCNKKLPIEQWEKKLDFEDERKNEAQLIDKINNNELNKKINKEINKIKENQFEELKQEQSIISNKYDKLIGILSQNFKKILNSINEINSLFNRPSFINLDYMDYLLKQNLLAKIGFVSKLIINQMKIIKNEINILIDKNVNNNPNKEVINNVNEKYNEQNEDYINEINLLN